MIESLHQVSPDARIAVFCFDDRTRQVLDSLGWDFVRTVSLAEFEDPELLRVKPTRSRGEYCWTSTPATLVYCLERLGFESCTYLDADLFFYSSPEPAFIEKPEASVLLTGHRYTPMYDQSATSGKYCVQFMFFRRDPAGLRALHWWRDRCLEWCYNRMEDGKFGDQKYLDDWTTRFDGVHEIQNPGIGVAPWNVQQLRVETGVVEGPLLLSNGGPHPVVFYHFHALKLTDDGHVDLSAYRLSTEVIDLIYRPYLKRLLHWERELETRFQYRAPRPPGLSLWKRLGRRVRGNLNYLPLEGV